MQGTRGRRRRRLTPIALTAGVLGSAVLGLGATGTYSSLTATLTNSTNTAGSGTLVMRETDENGAAASTCTTGGTANNTATCASPDLYGGSSTMTPGGTASTTRIRIYDDGTLDPATFTMRTGACSSSNGVNDSSAGDICKQLQLSLTCTMTSAGGPGSPISVYSNETLRALDNTTRDLKGLGCLPTKNSGTYALLEFTVQLASGATSAAQGARASQQVVWTFTV